MSMHELPLLPPMKYRESLKAIREEIGAMRFFLPAGATASLLGFITIIGDLDARITRIEHALDLPVM